MNELSDEQKINQVEQKVIMQMITFCVIIIVVILTLVSFIRIYSNKKTRVLKDMKTEFSLLETVLIDHLSYSEYFINIIDKNIQRNPKNLSYIHNILKDHYTSQDFNMLFGWRKYSWINDKFLEVVTNTQGIVPHPKPADFVKKIVNNSKTANKVNITFHTSQNIIKGNSLKIIDTIFDKNDKYLGAVVLSYDIDTMIQSLNRRKKNSSTNFVILNQKLEMVAQSKSTINNVINYKGEIDYHLNNVLEKRISSAESTRTSSYLDMMNGVNYFVGSLQGVPFTIIVNIDNDIIKADIINSITKKFVEVCIFAFFCLFVVIAIYKRETFLRSKAEKAMVVANNATKAKTNFLAFTAHEIRSPLGFILTGSELMTKELIGKLPEKYKEYSTGIYNNAKIILDFITDILDENQIMEGKFKIVNTLANVPEIINEAIRVNVARYSNKKINISSDIEKKLPLLVCDRRRILQIIGNLVSNSIKYSSDNSTIQIAAKVINEGMEIKVIDQGIGMNQDEIPIALSTYGTIHNRHFDSSNSYGLGLPIVKMLLDAHDANLHIESKKNVGTTVKIIFPKYKLIYDAKQN